MTRISSAGLTLLPGCSTGCGVVVSVLPSCRLLSVVRGGQPFVDDVLRRLWFSSSPRNSLQCSVSSGPFCLSPAPSQHTGPPSALRTPAQGPQACPARTGIRLSRPFLPPHPSAPPVCAVDTRGCSYTKNREPLQPPVFLSKPGRGHGGEGLPASSPGPGSFHTEDVSLPCVPVCR